LIGIKAMLDNLINRSALAHASPLLSLATPNPLRGLTGPVPEREFHHRRAIHRERESAKRLVVFISRRRYNESGGAEVTTLLFTAVLHKDGDWYVAECPEVGTVSQGVAIEDALVNLKEATELYLEEFP
jgi:hypothetical protein